MRRKNAESAEQWLVRALWFATGAIAAWTLADRSALGGTNAGVIAGMGVLVAGLVGLSAIRARRGDRDRAALSAGDPEASPPDSERGALVKAEKVLAITAHEMRGPLTAITGASTTLRSQHNQLSEVERAALMNMTLRQARHLALLVDDLLVTVDLGSAGVTLRPEWTDLESVVERALESAASKRSAHRLDVSVEPIRCNIDASRTVQIIRNLVENAYKYTPEESTVRVAVKMADGDLVIEVADDGHGIPAEDHESLFEPYRRGDAMSASHEGIGIGLHVVRRLAEAMGGRVELASSDRGTTFSVVIPTEAASEQPSVVSVIDTKVLRGQTA